MFKKHYALMAIVFAVAVGASGCALVNAISQSVTTPKVTFKTAELREVTLQGVSLDFLFEVQNPNAVGAEISSLAYDLRLNGSRFAKGTTKEALRVEPHGTSDVRFPFEINFQELGRTMSSLLGGQSTVKYELDVALTFDTSIGRIEVKRSADGEIEIPKPSLLGG